MEISVIIPAYNCENVLMDAIESIASQTAIDSVCEIIIVNDGSTDSTLMVMKKIKQEKKLPIVLISKENGGASSARNAGLKIAKGDWIALLDGDDEWLPTKLQRQMKILTDHPEIDFLGCGSDDRTLRILYRKIDHLYKASVQDLCIKNFPVTPTILFRKEILSTIGYFDENRKYMEDNDFCLRVCEKFNYYYLPESLVKTGHGKQAIGDTGLSSNVTGMYLGRVKNMQDLYHRHSISWAFYSFIRGFNYMKYLRRKWIQKLHKGGTR